MTTYTTFIWVHACVKDRVLEHLHGVFIFCHIYLYRVRRKGLLRWRVRYRIGALAGYYILIPIVYTTIFFFMLLPIYFLHHMLPGIVQEYKSLEPMAVISKGRQERTSIFKHTCQLVAGRQLFEAWLGHALHIFIISLLYQPVGFWKLSYVLAVGTGHVFE